MKREVVCRVLQISILALALGACVRREPPGADRKQAGAVTLGVRPARAADSAASLAPLPSVPIGTRDDNLPFTPDGTRIASTAMRTWIYSDVGAERKRYGYLRVGAIVDARGPPIENTGCRGAWYRVNPRGFVCLGLGATLDQNHPSVVASQIRPRRSRSLPYLYGLAEQPPPLLYFRLASRREVQAAEGLDGLERASSFRDRARRGRLQELLGPIGPPPAFLGESRKLLKPYGTKQGLHLSAHAGPAARNTGFAFTQVFEWEGRIYGLTTELELVGLERIKLVTPTSFRGLELTGNQSLPVAFVKENYATRYFINDRNQIEADGYFERRTPLRLTGNRRPGAMLEAEDRVWVSESSLLIVPPRSSFPSIATGDRKWIDVSINDQTLVAYTGRKPVYATLVSTGRGGADDPETTQATIQGTFMIHHKDVSSTMDGEEDSEADSFALRDVPFVQYFHRGFALHGAYWHDDFGRARSHGCINLSPEDAAWLFEWTDPAVPTDWHGVINKERGTAVYVHP